MYYDPSGHIAFFVVTGIIGAVVGFGLATYNDYSEDGVWFNGSVGSYIGYTLGGAAIGAVCGLGAGLGGMAFAVASEEDPTFTVRTDEQSGQTIISGMGELHLDIILDRLKREFKVECNQGKPQVNYKEAITKTVNLREVYKKQSGGRGKFWSSLM